MAASLIAAAIAYGVRPRGDAPTAAAPRIRFAVEPPPGFFIEGAGNRQSFALSPDGSKLAFTAMDDSGLFRVFLRNLEQLESREVAQSMGASTVFWHPDSKSLFFVSGGKLRRTSGDAPQMVSDSVPGLLSGVWLSPDRMLLSTRLISATVSSSGGALRRGEHIYAWPQLMPDGATLLHVVFDRKIGRYRAKLARYGEPVATEILESDSKVVYTRPGYLLYVRAGTLLAQAFDVAALRTTGDPVAVARSVCSFLATAAADFAVSDAGVLVYQQCIPRSQLMWVDREGRHLSPASPDGVSLKAARVSHDGRRVATSVFDVDRGVTDAWLFDADGSGGRRLAGPGLSHSPVWSPDSNKVVLARALERPPKLFIRSLEANEAEEALPEDHFQMPTDWSRDGRFIVYTNAGMPLIANEQQGDILAVDLMRNRRIIPLINTSHHEVNGVFSPDGGWVAFTSNDSGRTEVYVQALEAGESLRVMGQRHSVSRHGAQCLRWRSDGKELYYVGADGWIYAVPVQLGAAPKIGSPSRLFKISTAARAAIHALAGFDVSADGQRFVIPVVTSPDRPSLVVVQNWHRQLN